MKSFFAAVFATTIGFIGLGLSAQAENYPSKSIRLIVPYPPGGASDTLSRILADALSPRLSQPVIVENRAGAGTSIGIDFAAKAKPDGYTILWGPTDGLTILPAVKVNVPYKVPDDFSFIARMVQLPTVVGVNAKLPIMNIADLIAYAKANPGKLRYGTSGIGSAPHMGAILLGQTADIELVHVPFTGIGTAITSLLGGFIDMTLAAPSTLKGHAEAGAVRVLVTMGPDRHPEFPNVPTLRESGLPFEVQVFYGLMAPAGVPEAILAKLRTEMSESLKDPKVVERLRSIGYRPEFLAGDDFKAHVVKDLEMWRAVAKKANIAITE